MKTYHHHMLPFAGLLFLVFLQLTFCLQVKKYPLLMPNVYPDQDDLYLCTSVRVVPDKNFYIVGFEPNATMKTVHHMLLFGCVEPGTKDDYWDCGEMASSGLHSRIKKNNTCLGSSLIIFAWGLDASPLKLPEDVGFQVGKSTPIQYLVLQMHYLKKFKDDQRDNSGLNLIYTEEPQSKLAGVIILGTAGVIPPRSITNMEIACTLDENKTIYPFAYRTHTHSLGRVVSGYSIHRDRSGMDHWSLLGKRDPMTPQMFYPVFNREAISFGDRLAARCTMDSSEKYTSVKVGPTHEDEMCNFYLMYYVERGKPLDRKYCMSNGPPLYYWNIDNNVNNIPDIEASSLD